MVKISLKTINVLESVFLRFKRYVRPGLKLYQDASEILSREIDQGERTSTGRDARESDIYIQAWSHDMNYNVPCYRPWSASLPPSRLRIMRKLVKLDVNMYVWSPIGYVHEFNDGDPWDSDWIPCSDKWFCTNSSPEEAISEALADGWQISL